MGARLPASGNTVLQSAGFGAAETVVLVTNPISIPFDSCLVFLMFYIEGVIGGSTASTNYRIRRGATTAGALVNVIQNVADTGGVALVRTFAYVDTVSNVANQQWCFTMQQNGAALNSNMGDGCAIAFVL